MASSTFGSDSLARSLKYIQDTLTVKVPGPSIQKNQCQARDEPLISRKLALAQSLGFDIGLVTKYYPNDAIKQNLKLQNDSSLRSSLPRKDTLAQRLNIHFDSGCHLDLANEALELHHHPEKDRISKALKADSKMKDRLKKKDILNESEDDSVNELYRALKKSIAATEKLLSNDFMSCATVCKRRPFGFGSLRDEDPEAKVIIGITFNSKYAQNVISNNAPRRQQIQSLSPDAAPYSSSSRHPASLISNNISSPLIPLETNSPDTLSPRSPISSIDGIRSTLLSLNTTSQSPMVFERVSSTLESTSTVPSSALIGRSTSRIKSPTSVLSPTSFGRSDAGMKSPTSSSPFAPNLTVNEMGWRCKLIVGTEYVMYPTWKERCEFFVNGNMQALDSGPFDPSASDSCAHPSIASVWCHDGEIDGDLSSCSLHGFSVSTDHINSDNEDGHRKEDAWTAYQQGIDDFFDLDTATTDIRQEVPPNVPDWQGVCSVPIDDSDHSSSAFHLTTPFQPDFSVRARASSNRRVPVFVNRGLSKDSGVSVLCSTIVLLELFYQGHWNLNDTKTNINSEKHSLPPLVSPCDFHSSLMYGEVKTAPFITIIGRAVEAYRSWNDGSISLPIKFCDLGSGSGKAVVSASATMLFNECVGIEIVPERYRQSQKIIETIRGGAEAASWTITLADGTSDELTTTSQLVVARMEHIAESCSFFLNNFLDASLMGSTSYNWLEANVVFFSCVSVFSPHLLQQLVLRMNEMRVGSIIISVGGDWDRDADILYCTTKSFAQRSQQVEIEAELISSAVVESELSPRSHYICQRREKRDRRRRRKDARRLARGSTTAEEVQAKRDAVANSRQARDQKCKQRREHYPLHSSDTSSAEEQLTPSNLSSPDWQHCEWLSRLFPSVFELVDIGMIAVAWGTTRYTIFRKI